MTFFKYLAFSGVSFIKWHIEMLSIVNDCNKYINVRYTFLVGSNPVLWNGYLVICSP